ncbi:MAG: hypothetical protein ABI960_10240 [Candidatus Eisenbacteria bacterium]
MRAQGIRATGISLLSVVFVATAASAARAPERNFARTAEVEHVCEHILRAEQAIASNLPPGWSAAQRSARQENLARLATYRRQAVFPHNEDFPGQRVPYFRDRHGVLCAIADLIETSGRHDLVDLVARRRNYATVLELAADPVIGPALAAWLAQAGLTVAEAQAVQPDYGMIPLTKQEEISHFRRNSAMLGVVSLGATALNAGALGSRPTPGWCGALGFAAGGFQIILGAQKLPKDSVVASFDLFVGGAAMLTSISALAAGGADRRSSDRAPGDGARLSTLVGFDRHLAPQAGLSLSF